MARGRLRRGAARPPARVQARAGVRRGLRPQGRAGEGVVRAARRLGRAAVLDVAQGLGRAAASTRSATAPSWSPPAAATSTPARAPPRRRSPSRSRSCAWRARATCSPRSSGCAARSPRRGCSSRRSGCPGRRCRARSASSPARAARRATTCWPACAAAAGRATLVWAFAPVQDRHAAPAITRALQDLAACEAVEVIVVARGGGSLADLFAFCDETLCRTVALLRVPVDLLRRPPHRPHADRRRRRGRVLDARRTPPRPPCRSTAPPRARSCAGSPRGSSSARGWRSSSAPACSRGSRARPPTTSSATAPACTSTRASCARPRAAGWQTAGAPHRRPPRSCSSARRAPRAGAEQAQRARNLERLALALAAHEPQRALERGYALVEDPAGEPVTSAAAAREHAELTLRLHDGTVSVRPRPYA